MEIRQMDFQNRITLSAKIRKAINADERTIFRVEVIDGKVILTPVDIVDKK